MLNNPLQLVPAVIVTRPDERGEQAGTLLYKRSQGGPKELLPPQIFRKYSHFVL